MEHFPCNWHAVNTVNATEHFNLFSPICNHTPVIIAHILLVTHPHLCALAQLPPTPSSISLPLSCLLLYSLCLFDKLQVFEESTAMWCAS